MASGIDWDKSYWLSPEQVSQEGEMKKEQKEVDRNIGSISYEEAIADDEKWMKFKKGNN